MISILLPVYNAAPFLQVCLDSILQQTMDDWELLAVDDFSTDDSLSILQAYQANDRRIRWFSNTQKGIIPALRHAYSKSRGQYITRMDADDRMPPAKLEKLIEALKTHGAGRLSTGLVRYFSDTQLLDGYRRYEQWINTNALSGNPYQEIYRECVIPSPCWMIHRDDLDRCGAFHSDTYPEDYDLVFRFYKHQIQPVVVPEVLHLWRDHAARSSRTMEQYANQAYFQLKLPYFLKLDYDATKPLVLWGAGRKGKTLARMLQQEDIAFRWVCDNPEKWGKDIYGVRLENFRNISGLDHPQVIVAVSNPKDQEEIRGYLDHEGIEEVYFFV